MEEVKEAKGLKVKVVWNLEMGQSALELTFIVEGTIY